MTKVNICANFGVKTTMREFPEQRPVDSEMTGERSALSKTGWASSRTGKRTWIPSRLINKILS
jgi:hypothetical protein